MAMLPNLTSYVDSDHLYSNVMSYVTNRGMALAGQNRKRDARREMSKSSGLRAWCVGYKRGNFY